MLRWLAALTLAAFPLVYGQDSDVTTVMDALTSAKVVPDVVPSFTPRFPLDVRFTANGTVFPVTAGAHLTVNRKYLHFSRPGHANAGISNLLQKLRISLALR